MSRKTLEYEVELKKLQDLVGGYIEVVDLGRRRVLIINEEGKLKHLPENRVATGIMYRYKGEENVMPGDYIAGNAIFTYRKNLE